MLFFMAATAEAVFCREEPQNTPAADAGAPDAASAQIQLENLLSSKTD